MAKSIEDIVARAVRERFARSVIDSIVVEADQDSDGDPVLVITVVFNSEIAELDSRELAGLASRVRPKLLAQQEPAFPIFRFMTKRDRDRMGHEAA